jgi:hypothetical protein
MSAYYVYAEGDEANRRRYQSAFRANLAAFWVGLKSAFPNPGNAKRVCVEGPWQPCIVLNETEREEWERRRAGRTCYYVDENGWPMPPAD